MIALRQVGVIDGPTLVTLLGGHFDEMGAPGCMTHMVYVSAPVIC